jgi:hypothetical protein
MATERSGGAPTPAGHGTDPAPTSPRGEIEAFLAQARSLGPAGPGRGRLIFALDATFSRQPTWESASQLQADMFAEAARAGGLDVQLVYYRGLSECRASRFVSDGARLADLMGRISCRGGPTQIGRVLDHARREAERAPVRVLVFVGDAVEESADELAGAAAALGMRGVRAFIFQEGFDPSVEQAFRAIARLTNGAYCRFDVGAADQLRELLRAAAAYAAGGLAALTDLSARQNSAQRLLAQMT